MTSQKEDSVKVPTHFINAMMISQILQTTKQGTTVNKRHFSFLCPVIGSLTHYLLQVHHPSAGGIITLRFVRFASGSLIFNTCYYYVWFYFFFQEERKK